MTTAHTPGPWIFRQWGLTDEVLEQMTKAGINPVRMLTNSGAAAVTADDVQVATVNSQTPFKKGQGHLVDCPVRDANARLIAAAPELLEALKELYAANTDTFNDEDYDKIEPDSLLGKARAAIAKAEGGAA
jgi:hypothetical protein